MTRTEPHTQPTGHVFRLVTPASTTTMVVKARSEAEALAFVKRYASGALVEHVSTTLPVEA